MLYRLGSVGHIWLGLRLVLGLGSGFRQLASVVLRVPQQHDLYEWSVLFGSTMGLSQDRRHGRVSVMVRPVF